MEERERIDAIERNYAEKGSECYIATENMCILLFSKDEGVDLDTGCRMWRDEGFAEDFHDAYDPQLEAREILDNAHRKIISSEKLMVRA